MARAWTLCGAGVLLTFLCGCGGGGGTPFAFQGGWTGPWSAVDRTGQVPDRGTLNIAVDPSGNVTGAVLDTTVKTTWQVTGKVDRAGTLHMTFSLPPADSQLQIGNPLPQDVIANYQGAVNVSSGHLTGTANAVLGATAVQDIAFDLTPVSTVLSSGG